MVCEILHLMSLKEFLRLKAVGMNCLKGTKIDDCFTFHLAPSAGQKFN